MGGRAQQPRRDRLNGACARQRSLRLEALEDRRLLALTGDMDLDRDVDFDDIDELVLGLNNPAEYQNRFGVSPHVAGDTSGDGRLDPGDIPRFVEILFARRTVFFAGLANDTAPASRIDDDGLTSDATLFGVVVHGFAHVASLEARIDAESVLNVELSDTGGALFDPGLLLDGTADGPHNVRFVLTDIDGQVSTIFDVPFTLDTTPPSAPSLDLDPAFDSDPVGDQRTTLDEVTLVGATDDAVVVQLAETGVETESDANGVFEFSGVLLDVGANPFTVRAMDAAGNETAASQSIRRLLLGDDVEPPTIQAGLLNDTGRDSADGITSDATISGTVVDDESIGLVELTVPELGSAPWDITGMVDPDTDTLSLSQDIVEFLLGSPLPDGSYTYWIQVEDSSGNASAPFHVRFTLDRTPPHPPMLPDLAARSDTGSSDSDDVTRDTLVTIRVDAETGSLVTLSVDDDEVGQAEANSQAAFTTGPLDDGVHSITAVGIDLAGNASEMSQALAITVDTVPPAPVLDAPTAGETVNRSSRLSGSVDGTGSSADMLSYQFGGQVPIPVATDQRGRFDRELQLAGVADGSNTLSVAAFDRAGNVATTEVDVDVAQNSVAFDLVDHLPVDGADEVGVTFHPQIFFSKPVDPTTLNADNFFASFGGEKLPANIVPAGDGHFAWLFFEEPLPGSSRIQVTVDGSAIFAQDDRQALNADGSSEPGGVFSYDFTTVSRMPLVGTRLSGIVADPGPDRLLQTADDFDPGPDGMAGTEDDVFLLPIPGIKVYLLGLENDVRFTDAGGRFSFDTVPAGDVKVVVDGTTATNPPAGMYFPEMVMDAMMTAGADNTVMAGLPEVYLPRLSIDILQSVDASVETVIVANAGGAPDLSPDQRQLLSLEILPGSLIAPDGSSMGTADVGISTVPPEFVRTMLPPGVLQETFNITIQALGVSNFSTPAPLSFPNVYGAAPGTQLNLISFDHTTGRLVVEGTGTVSADGLFVRTDPGMGIAHPGWHGFTREGTTLRSRRKPVDDPEVMVEPDLLIGEIEGARQLVPLEDHLFFKGGEGVSLFFANLAEMPEGTKEQDITPLEITIDPLKNSKQQTFFVDFLTLEGTGIEARDPHSTSYKMEPQTFDLLPGSEQIVQVRTKDRAPRDQRTLQNNQLGHTSVTITAKKKGSNSNLFEKTVYYYRFLDNTDLEPDDGILSFEDTVVDGLLGLGVRRKPILSLGLPASRPVLETEDPDDLVFETIVESTKGITQSNTVVFNPVEVSENQGEWLIVKTPADQEAGRILLQGNGTPSEKVFLNPEGLKDVLQQIVEGPPPQEIVLGQVVENTGTATFRLAVDGHVTQKIPLRASASEVERRLVDDVPTIDSGDVTVTRLSRNNEIGGGRLNIVSVSYTVTFGGRFLSQSAPAISVHDFGNGMFLDVKNGLPAVFSTIPDRDALITAQERQLLDEPQERDAIAEEILRGVMDRYSQFEETVHFIDSPQPGSVHVKWSTSSNRPLFGTSQPGPTDDGVDNIKAMREALEESKSESLNQRIFRFNQAVNLSRETDVVIFPDNMLELAVVNPLSLDRNEFINFVSKVTAHEVAHTIGSLHSAQPELDVRQEERQVVQLAGGNAMSSFTLTFDGQTTSPISRTASAMDLKMALEALSNVVDDSLVVKKLDTDLFLVVFGDPPKARSAVWRGTDLPKMEGMSTDPADGLDVFVATAVDGKAENAVKKDFLIVSGFAIPVDLTVTIGGVEGTEDIMYGGFPDIEGETEFKQPLGGAMLSVGLDFADEATVQHAIGFFERNEEIGPFAAIGLQDTELLPRLKGPRLRVRGESLDVQGRVDFATVSVDGTGDERGRERVTLSNAGDELLEINSVSLSDPAGVFSVDGADSGVTLGPAESLELVVTFDPETSGVFRAMLSVNSNDERGVVDVDLFGIGRSPHGDLRLDILSNNASGVKVGGGGTTREAFATIRNIGAGPLTLTDVVMGQIGMGQFDIVGLPDGFGPESPLILEPDERYDLDLLFDPASVGLQRGSFALISDDPDTRAFVQPIVGTGLARTGIGVGYGRDFVAVDFPFDDNAVDLRDVSDTAGNFDFFIAPETSFHVSIFDPVSGLVADFFDDSEPSGQATDLGPPVFVASAEHDSDGDGLPDDIEFTIGTARDATDTDGDGLDDFAEIQQGLDPAGGLSFSGIIGAVALDGNAMDVAIAANPEDADRMLAYVATSGSGGLAVVDVTDPSNLVVLAQLNLDGENTDVRVDSLSNTAVVGGGSAGVHLVDVSDPTGPKLTGTIPTGQNARAVETHAGFAYVADGVRLLAIDLGVGQVVGRPLLVSQQPITDIAREGNRLYTMDGSIALHVIEVDGPTMTARGSLDTFQGGTQLFVDRDVAYLAARFTFGGGFATVDVSDPDHPAIISLSDASGGGALPRDGIVTNGSGLGLLISGSGNQGLSIMDVSDPEVTNAFLAGFALPAFAHAVSVGAGRAYLANGTAGLQVVNFQSVDLQGQSPSVAVGVLAGDADPDSDGLQIVEGGVLPLLMDVTDDVQVRRVDLLIDGQIVNTDYNNSYQMAMQVPLIADGRSQFMLQVRATDTGGNVSMSEPIELELVPDMSGPRIIRVDPPLEGTRPPGDLVVEITFDEWIDPSTVSAATFQLLDSSGSPVAADGEPLLVSGRTVQLPVSNLSADDYRVFVDSDQVTDTFGNAFGTDDIVSQFSVIDGTVFWINPLGGSWNEPANWSTGTVPGPADDVVVGVPGDVAVQLNQIGDVSVRRLFSEERLSVIQLNVAIDQQGRLGGGVDLSRGDLRIDGPVTLDGTSLWINTSSVQGEGVLNHDGTLHSFTSPVTVEPVLNNRGTILQAGNQWTVGEVNNLPGANYEFQGFATLTGANGVFNNQGTMVHGGTNLTTVRVPVNNSGVVDVQAGTLLLSASGSSSINENAIYHIADGSALQFGAGQNRFIGTSRFDGEGRLRIFRTAPVTVETEGELTLALNGAGVQVDSGTDMTINGSLINDGRIVWNGGRIDVVGEMINRGTLDLANASSGTLSGTLDNEGTILQSNRVLTVDGATINNLAGGVFDVTASAGINDVAGTINVLNNLGTLTKSGGGGFTNFDLPVINSGLMQLQIGTSNFLQGVTQTAGTLSLAGGTLAGNAPLDLQGGLLTGAGRITAEVINSATIEVGGAGIAGLLEMTQPYTQTSTGTLNIEVGGTEPEHFDRLGLSGNMTLAGTLTVRLIGDFTPADVDLFDIITFGTRIGDSQFGTVMLPTGLETITYNDTGRRITVQ